MINSLGIMTGTSIDGVDAGLIKTDAKEEVRYIESVYKPFPKHLSKNIKALMHEKFDIKQYRLVEKEYTEFCYYTISDIASKHNVGVIGFHGQTLYHDPQNLISHQMGYWKYMQKLSGIEVISDLRTDDILRGREGAPLVPLFHKAAIKDKPPFAVINIGGVSNITYIGKDNEVIGFDIGPGCAPINDIMQKYYGLSYDKDGKNSSLGKKDERILDMLILHEYFNKPYPKSLDRNQFDYKPLEALSPKDQLATVSHFIVNSILHSYKLLPSIPNITYLCGGGRKNKFLFSLLQKNINIKQIDSIGLDGDMLEAYAFAYLAARKKMGLYCGSV